jgi:hypothetical protein
MMFINLFLAAGLATALPADTACITMNTDRMPLAGRQSPLDSATVMLEGGAVKLCYSRPSTRGRTMIGGNAVPHDKIWRTGANEPTMLHTTLPITAAGVALEPGSYSLYTVPGESQWQVVLNRSITQWGHENFYTGEVVAAEIARRPVRSEQLEEHVEQHTMKWEKQGAGAADLVLEWEHTRVRIPVRKQ